MTSEQKAVIVRYLIGSCSAADFKEVERALRKGVEEGEWRELLEEQGVPDIVPAEEKMERLVLERIRNEINRVDTERKGVVRKWAAAAMAAVLLIGFFGYHYSGRVSDRAIPLLVNTEASSTPTFLALEDQSEIWINSRSVLSYPSQFSSTKREVALNGQAFFKVAKEKKRQFVVHAGELAIKVLGTSFDVKSYAEENETVITLLTGRIDVEMPDTNQHTLFPNQQLIFDKTTKMVTLRNVKASRYENWRYREIIFVNLSLGQIAKGLESRFNRVVRVEEAPKGRLFTLKIKSGGLDEALKILSYSANLSYFTRGDTVVIRPLPTGRRSNEQNTKTKNPKLQ